MIEAEMDSQTLVKRLQAGGLSEEAAEALAEAVLQRPSDIATKQDLIPLAAKEDLHELASKQSVEDLRRSLPANVAAKEDLSGLATKQDLQALATSQQLKDQWREIRIEFTALRAQMAQMEARLTHTIHSAVLTSTLALAAIFGAMVTIVKLGV
jgi:hypothetical protein